MATTQADALAMTTTTAAPAGAPVGPQTLHDRHGPALRRHRRGSCLRPVPADLHRLLGVQPAGTLSTQSLIPKGASGVNFSTLFEIRPYWSWYKNTLFIAAVGTVIAVFIGRWPRTPSHASGSPVAGRVCSCCCSCRCSPRS